MCLEWCILAKKSPELFIIQLEYIFIGQTSTVLEPLQSMDQLWPQPPNEREFPPFQQMVCKFTSPTHQNRRWTVIHGILVSIKCLTQPPEVTFLVWLWRLWTVQLNKLNITPFKSLTLNLSTNIQHGSQSPREVVWCYKCGVISVDTYIYISYL